MKTYYIIALHYVIFLLTHSFSTSYGQSTSTNIESAQLLFEQGIDYYQAGSLDEATLSFQKAASLYKEKDSLGMWLKAYRLIARISMNNGQSSQNELFQKSVQIITQTLNDQWRSPLTANEWYELARVYYRLALLSYQSGDYLGAKKAYERMGNYWHHTEQDSNDLIYLSYRELGSIYTFLQDFVKAEDYLKQAITGATSNDDEQELLYIHIALGRLEDKQEHYTSAIQYYEKALEIGPDNPYDLGLIHINLGEAYRNLSQYSQSLYHLNIALNQFQRLEDQESLSRVYLTLAEVYRDQSQFDAALPYYDQALETAINTYQTAKRREIAEIHLSRALFHRLQAEYNLALLQYHRALSCLIPHFIGDGVEQLPQRQELYTEIYMLEALAGKADMFEAKYVQSQQTQDLSLALTYHQLCNNVEDSLRLGYDYELSKLNLVEKSRKRTQKAIHVAYTLFEQSQDSSYLHEAYRFAEKNKATVLLDLMKQAEARNISELPDSVVVREASLRTNWIFLEKKFHEAQLIETLLNSQLQQERTVARQRYYQFLDSVEQVFPQFKQVAQNVHIAPIDSIQKELRDQSIEFVEFFMGESFIYTFFLNGQSLSVHQTPLDSSLKRSIERFPLYLEEVDMVPDFTRAAHTLYQSLIEPLSISENRLVIIPDGALSYIPFDVLLTHMPDTSASLKEYPYLLRQKSISYAYSATLLRERKQKAIRQRDMKSFLGYAPVFEEANLDVSFLNFSEDEVTFIHRLWGGTKRIGREATRDQFVKEAHQYKIIHISSHGQATEEDPLLSHIYFLNSAGQTTKLYLADLYAIDLNADLVVLSACETSRGEMLPGEGIMSLARGFTYAGSKSLLTTLWSIPHSPTYVFMKAFYKELFSGKAKDEAVRLAKLSYLQSEKTDKLRAHPRFWAAYTPVGDMSPLRNPLRKYIWFAGIGFLLLVLFLGWRRFK